jgi:hypothetical protein
MHEQNEVIICFQFDCSEADVPLAARCRTEISIWILIKRISLVNHSISRVRLLFRSARFAAVVLAFASLLPLGLAR